MPTSRTRKGCLIGLLLLLAGPPLLLFLATRSFVLTGVVLPALSRRTGMDIAADSISLSPETVVVRGLAATAAPEPDSSALESFEAESIHLDPEWKRLLRGDIAFSRVRLVRPSATLSIVTQRDPDAPDVESEAPPPPDIDIDIGKLEIVEGRLFARTDTGAEIEADPIHLSLSGLANDSPAALSGRFQYAYTVAEDTTDGTATRGQGSWEGDLVVGMGADLRPTSLKGATSLAATSPGPDLPDIRVEIRPDLALDHQAKRLSLRALDAKLRTDDQDRLTLHLSEPTTLDWSASPPRLIDTTLTLNLLPTRIRDLPFSSLLPLREGEVALDAKVTVSESGNHLAGNFRFSGEELTGTPVGLRLSEASLSVNARAEGDLQSIQVDSFTLSARNRGRDLGSARLSGRFSPDNGSGDLALENLTLHLHALSDLAPALPASAGTVDAEGRLTRDAEGTLRFRNRLRLTEGEVEGVAPPPSPLNLTLVGEAAATRLTIRAGRLNWPEQPGFRNEIELQGSMDLTDSRPTSLQLALVASTLDATPWLDVIPKSPDPASREVATTWDLTTSPLLPLEHTELTLQADTIRMRELSVTDVDFKLTDDGGGTRLEPASFAVNGSRIAFPTRIRTSPTGGDLSSDFSMAPLDLAPIFNTLHPDRRGAVQGMLEVNGTLAADAFVPENLLPSLRGGLDLSFTRGRLRLLEPDPSQPRGLIETRDFLRDLLTVLARALRIPPEALMEPPIETVALKGSLADSVVTLETFHAENPEFLLRTSGNIPIDPDDPGRTAFHALPVRIGLGTHIAKRVRLYREDRLEGDKIVLPPILEIHGTLAQPRVEVKTSVLSGLILTGITERNSTGNEDIDRALGVLGGLLGGEGPPPTPTPKPEP